MSWNPKPLHSRDQEAWRGAHKAFARKIYQYAFLRLRGDAEAAAEVTQEVFTRAIESIDGFSGNERRFMLWLFGISRRVIAQRLRSLRPKGTTIRSFESDSRLADSAMEPIDPKPLADEQIALGEEQLLTSAALSLLPINQEKALRLKYCDGLPVVEIARRLRTTPKAVESLLSRGRKGFRKNYLQLESSGKAPVQEVRGDAG